MTERWTTWESSWMPVRECIDAPPVYPYSVRVIRTKEKDHRTLFLYEESWTKVGDPEFSHKRYMWHDRPLPTLDEWLRENGFA